MRLQRHRGLLMAVLAVQTWRDEGSRSARTRRLLTENRNNLDASVEQLLIHETLDESDVAFEYSWVRFVWQSPFEDLVILFPPHRARIIAPVEINAAKKAIRRSATTSDRTSTPTSMLRSWAASVKRSEEHTSELQS